jgi:hypothetical protein
MRGVGSATKLRRISSGSGQVADETAVRGELCADSDVPEDNTESLELDARLLIDSSEELDLSSSCLSRSSSLEHNMVLVNVLLLAVQDIFPLCLLY